LVAIAVSLMREKFDQTASAGMPSWTPYIDERDAGGGDVGMCASTRVDDK